MRIYRRQMAWGWLLLFLLGIFGGSAAAAQNDDTDLRAFYEAEMQEKDYKIAKAIVRGIEYDDTAEIRSDIPVEADIRYQHLILEILTGEHRSEVLTVRHTIEMIMPGNYIFKVNDQVLIRLTENAEREIETVKIEERVRDTSIYVITALFAVMMLLIGRKQGLKALLSLIIMVSLIFFAYIPMILKGFSPILLSVAISALAITVTLVIISGRHKKTVAAILGTISGVLIAGFLAVIFGEAGRLTGLSADTAISLAYIPHFRGLDYKGLLFGTIIIGSIGAIMDVSLSIASSLWEIWELNPAIPVRQLIRSGMNIGRDIMGSMSNTLILAYVGTSLHLIILFMVYQISFTEIINYDSVSSEILRAMAGSIGLMFTIPATVWISAALYPGLKKIGEKKHG